MGQTVAQIIEEKVLKKLEEKRGKLSGIVVLDISGPEGGQWTLDCDNIKIERKDTPNPKVRIKMLDKDFTDMINGNLDAISATFSGKIKIEGDMAMATKLAMAIK